MITSYRYLFGNTPEFGHFSETSIHWQNVLQPRDKNYILNTENLYYFIIKGLFYNTFIPRYYYRPFSKVLLA